MSWGAYNDAMYQKMRDLEDRVRLTWKPGTKDWERECTECEGKPTVHPTELCGPCCFGEAKTINGNW